MQNNETIGSINTSAMKKGACLGLFGIASLVVFKWSFTLPLLSSLFTLMVLASPVLAALLTMRYRNESTEKFDFMKGFLHTLFMGFYASIWVAVVVFVYLQYFDHGTIFVAYGQSIDTPEIHQYLMQSGIDAQLYELSGAHGVQGLVSALQSMGAATYASMPLYSAMFFGPIISVIVGVICRRK